MQPQPEAPVLRVLVVAIVLKSGQIGPHGEADVFERLR